MFITSLQSLQNEFNTEFEKMQTLQELDSLKAKYLGKDGIITGLLSQMHSVPSTERRDRGQAINAVKNNIANLIEIKFLEIKQAQREAKIKTSSIDITMPGDAIGQGTPHIISIAIDEAIAIGQMLGFQVVQGPELDNQFNNFDALNFSQYHPARTEAFFCGQNLLRTQTSTVQIRHLMEHKYDNEIRIISVGKVYRPDYDATHTPMFHQMECLYLSAEASIANMKYTIESFLQAFFSLQKIPLRFRSSFFPFTEPSFEVDIICQLDKQNTQIGIGDRWLEIMGCGMVHRNVLNAVGLSIDKLQGFAFGLGIERLAMLKYGISDIRNLYSPIAQCGLNRKIMSNRSN